jgi:hypothetical protein
LYGQQRLQITNDGLHPDNDPDDLQTMGALSVLVYRLAAASETPFDCALARLATLTGALLVSPQLGGGPEIVKKWAVARAEVLLLQLPASK